MTSSATPRDHYTRGLAERTARLGDLSARRDRLGYFRLATAAVIVALVWLAIQGQVPLWTVAAPIALFVAFLWLQSRIERTAECTRRSTKFFEHGIARLDNR